MNTLHAWSPFQTPIRPLSFHTPHTSPLMPRSPNNMNAQSPPLSAPQQQPAHKIFSIPLSPPLTPKSLPAEQAHQAERTRSSLQNPRGVITSQQEDSADAARQLPPRGRRRVNPNPLLRGSDVQARRRRDKYLNRIQDDREAARWNVRSDQMLHQDFLAQRRAWEAEQARIAESYDGDAFTIYEDYDDPGRHAALNAQPLPSSDQMDTAGTQQLQQESPNEPMDDAGQIEQILDQEARELDALIAMHQHQNQDYSHTVYEQGNTLCSSPRYGSEDEEFEEMLFALSQNDDDMDMS